MAWKYFKFVSGGSGTSETNPYEFNILAGATQCQVGGTIESDRAPMWSELSALIDGNLTTATYWDDVGIYPTVIVTMPTARADLTAIQIPHTYTHEHHTVYLSEDKIEWILCPFLSDAGSTQNFSIPALPQTNNNFTAQATLNITRFTPASTQIYTQNSLDFEQTASQNISVTESALQVYTAKGYSFNTNTSEIINVSETASQELTAVGYSFEQTATLNISLADSSASDYTPIGYSYEQTMDDSFSLVQSGALTYSAVGYSFEQSTGTSLFLNDLANQWISMEGYNQQQNAIENIFLLASASQVFTAQGYIFEQSGLEDLSFVDTASQTYTAIGYSREEIVSENIFLSPAGIETYTESGYSQEQTTAQNISLSDSASQTYTAKGYSYEQAGLEGLSMIQSAVQDYVMIGYSRESSTIDYFGLLQSAESKKNNQGYSLHQIALNVIKLDITSNKIYTQSHTFLSDASEDLILLDAGTQDFRANFEQSATEQMDPLFVITTVNVIYSEGLKFDTQFALVPSILLTTEIEKLFIPFPGYHFVTTESQPISLNETVSLIWEQGQEGHYNQRATAYLYLQETTEKIYEQNFLNFTTGKAESFSLDFSASSDHKIIFAQEAVEIIELSDSAHSLYELNYLDLQANTLEIISLDLGAISELTEAHIFGATASQIIEVSITAVNQYQNINAHAGNAIDPFGLVPIAISDYFHINVFKSKGKDLIHLDDSASFLITTEPRDHIGNGSLLLKLNIYIQIYFESDIYKPTYEKEISKPNTLWEPLEKDREMVELNKIPSQGVNISDTIFSNTHERYKEDRRIFNLIGSAEPITINYASESIKKDSVYQLTASDQLQLDERGLSID